MYCVLYSEAIPRNPTSNEAAKDDVEISKIVIKKYEFALKKSIAGMRAAKINTAAAIKRPRDILYDVVI